MKVNSGIKQFLKTDRATGARDRLRVDYCTTVYTIAVKKDAITDNLVCVIKEYLYLFRFELALVLCESGAMFTDPLPRGTLSSCCHVFTLSYFSTEAAGGKFPWPVPPWKRPRLS